MSAFHFLFSLILLPGIQAIWQEAETMPKMLGTQGSTPLRLLMCITGQRERLELKSKIRNFIQPNVNKGHVVDVVTILDNRKNAKFVNKAPSLIETTATNDTSLLLQSVHNLHQISFRQPDNPLPVSWYIEALDKSTSMNETERMQGHVRQYLTMERCYDEMLTLEFKNQKRYDEIFRLREDTVLLAPINPLHEQAEPIPDYLVNECDCWYNGTNDKGALMLRRVAKTHFRGFRTALYLDKSILDSTVRIRNPETFTLSILQKANFTIKKSMHDMPVVPIRTAASGVVSQDCLHALEQTCWKNYYDNYKSETPYCVEIGEESSQILEHYQNAKNSKQKRIKKLDEDNTGGP